MSNSTPVCLCAAENAKIEHNILVDTPSSIISTLYGGRVVIVSKNELRRKRAVEDSKKAANRVLRYKESRRRTAGNANAIAFITNLLGANVVAEMLQGLTPATFLQLSTLPLDATSVLFWQQPTIAYNYATYLIRNPPIVADPELKLLQYKRKNQRQFQFGECKSAYYIRFMPDPEWSVLLEALCCLAEPVHLKQLPYTTTSYNILSVEFLQLLCWKLLELVHSDLDNAYKWLPAAATVMQLLERMQFFNVANFVTEDAHVDRVSHFYYALLMDTLAYNRKVPGSDSVTSFLWVASFLLHHFGSLVFNNEISVRMAAYVVKTRKMMPWLFVESLPQHLDTSAMLQRMQGLLPITGVQVMWAFLGISATANTKYSSSEILFFGVLTNLLCCTDAVVQSAEFLRVCHIEVNNVVILASDQRYTEHSMSAIEIAAHQLNTSSYTSYDREIKADENNGIVQAMTVVTPSVILVETDDAASLDTLLRRAVENFHKPYANSEHSDFDLNRSLVLNDLVHCDSPTCVNRTTVTPLTQMLAAVSQTNRDLDNIKPVMSSLECVRLQCVVLLDAWARVIAPTMSHDNIAALRQLAESIGHTPEGRRVVNGRLENAMFYNGRFVNYAVDRITVNTKINTYRRHYLALDYVVALIVDIFQIWLNTGDAVMTNSELVNRLPASIKPVFMGAGANRV